MTTEILIVLALVVANGLFAMAEFAVISARKVRLQQRAERGDSGASAALKLAAEPTRFLSTVQIGITLIGTLAGALGGAKVAQSLSGYLDNVSVIGKYSEPISFAIVVLGITYLSLVFGELVPKRLALYWPDAVASLVARPMQLLSIVASPAVSVLTASTEKALSLIGVKGQKEPDVTEEEIKALIALGRQTGIVKHIEADLLLRAFKAGDRSVKDVMTPRPKVVWIENGTRLSDFLTFNARHYYSHFPVMDKTVDNVVGVLSVKDVLRATGRGELHQEEQVAKLMQSPLFVPETKAVLELIQEMREKGKGIAIVIDEFGGLSGLVTFKQLVGELVGQPSEESRQIEIRAVDEHTLEISGEMPVEEANAKLGLSIPAGGYHTVAGFMMSTLGRIPAKGDFVDHNNSHLVVNRLNGLRIELVHMVRQKPQQEKAAGSAVQTSSTSAPDSSRSLR